MFGVERRGFDHIPEAERTMTLRETAYFWVGTNANLFFVSVGVIALELGLSVWQALVAVVLGTLLFALVGVASIAGVRAGLPTMTFTRAAFGPRGNLPHGVLAWAALGRVRGDQLHLRRVRAAGADADAGLGRTRATLARCWRTLVVLGASAAIAIYGHATMVYLQRVFAVALTSCSSLVLVYSRRRRGLVGAAHGRPRRRGRRSRSILAAGAVIASGPISYLFNAPDWVRYLPSRTREPGDLLDGVRCPAA